MVQLTQEQFIERAMKVHGDKYDYSKSIYKKQKQNIIIICKKCKYEFLQTPGGHFKGDGCSKCSKNYRRTLEDFINESKKIHGDKYDYSKVIYKNNSTKVELQCKDCQQYIYQTPSVNLQGFGCKYCSRKKLSQQQAQQKIQQKFQIIGEYIGYDQKVKLQCIKCDYQLIAKYSGAIKMNCKQCKDINKEQMYIQNAIKVHGDKYEYISVQNGQIKMKCKKCSNIFQQQTYDHIQKKNGCKICSMKNYSKQQIEWLSFEQQRYKDKILTIQDGDEYKIPGTKFRTDGIILEQKIIFEFNGCFWHGCQKCFGQKQYNEITGDSNKELYEKTKQREQYLQSIGYKVISIWEHDWRRFIKSIKILQRKFRMLHK